MSVGLMKDYKLKLGSYAPRIHWVDGGTGTPCHGELVPVLTAIVAPYKVLLLFRCEFQQGEVVSRKVKESLLQHRNTHIDSISRELYKGLGTPDWGTRSRSQTVDSAADHQASSWVFDFSST
jgi:hypothetical protein